MVLTIDLDGAQVLLLLLNRVQKGDIPTDSELQSVLATNKFFVDFYCQWEGVNLESLIETICRFNQPEWKPSVSVLSALARGFQRAVEENDLLQTKLNFLKAVDTSPIVDHVLNHLPHDTPSQSTIHVTIDGFNGGFQYQGEMGLSLLGDITKPALFEAGVAHELHHVGFMYWVERDPIRQAVLKEQSGRAIAVRHVQNLLSEGLAIFYCSPYQIRADEAMGTFGTKLANYRREESHLFAQAESVLATSLNPHADFSMCLEAFEVMALDPDGILPMAHYLGARMVEVMSQFHPKERIIECVRSLSGFLPMYNQAAQKTNAFVYNPSIVEQFSQIWDFKGRDAGC
ncbi:MAG: DUF5700 domain-containing putative Zn-dependent protease [Chloroflexota bacterium]